MTADQLRSKGFIQQPDGSFLKPKLNEQGHYSGLEQVSVGTKPESDLHNQIMGYCDSQWPRWKFRHARMDRATTEEKGIEDFTLFLPGGVTKHVEVKKIGQKLRPEQQAWVLELEKLGHKVHTVYTFEEFLSLVAK